MTSQYRNILRFVKNRYDKKRLKNTSVSILCNNCVGGISHELGIQFRSPTVNLWMKPNDYINFLSNPKYYLSIEPVQIETDRGYPVGKIDDITLFFQHYKTFDDVIGKWKERTKRIQWDNLAVIFI